jgi:nucleotide-binding universal stress UspA family protein
MNDTKKIETIVVGTDFSDDARVALDWASDVARERGARIVLTHAATIAASMAMAPEFVPMDDSWYRAIEEGAREELERWAGTVRAKNVAVETVLGFEPAVASILEVAAGDHADLLVVGTRGLTGLKRFFLGSVAGRLVRRAPCPVVTVHGGAEVRRPVRTVLLPTDLSEGAARAAEAALQVLGDGVNRHVVLLHVYRYPVMFSAAPALVLTQQIADFVRDARARITAQADRLRERGMATEVIVEEGIPSERILAYAEELKVDLIAMGTHGHSGLDRLFLGSTAERVLTAAPCPVLTVHTNSPAGRS